VLVASMSCNAPSTSSIRSRSVPRLPGFYGRVTASVVAVGRKPRRRVVDLMIAATAIAEELPLSTTNPGDFDGLHDLLTVVPVARPPVPPEGR
jgi:hypothetical protein